MPAPDRPAAPLPGSIYHASSGSAPGGAQGIEELLRERLKLDDLLQQQFRRDITLLCTDIQDSTAYFERYGDLSGRQMVQHHNDLIDPLITSHQGTIVHSVRDTMMASYAEPTTAVQSAIAMQRALRDHNRGREVAEQIHIRIGINAGPGLVETQDVFGDVVNVAARVEVCALPDQILISSATYERLPPSVPCRFLGATEIKGKATPIELYEVSWDERRTFQETVLLRGPGVIARPTKIFALEVSREGERLKLSAHERWPGEERPVRHYEYLDVSLAAMQPDVDAMVALLQRITDRRGTLAAATWQEMKAQGAALYSQLLTPAIQARLRASTATDLFLYIDDALAAYRTATAKPHTLPWQQAIAYDRLGRLYATQGDTAKALEHYDKAMTQHHDLAVVYTNKAHLLDKLGKHQEALDLYRQALQLSPDDPLTTLLLRDAERRQQLAQDREQQQRIDQLVDELVRAYREDPRPAAPEDDWASRPLSLAFLPFQHQENPSARAEGERRDKSKSHTQAVNAHGQRSCPRGRWT